MEASTLLSTMHLFPHWNKRLLEDSYYEASQSQVKLLEDEGRTAVWEVCAWFGCETHGIPGLACRLLERYLFTALHGYLGGDNENQFQTLQAQIPLLIASCISLASKMNNSASRIVAKVVHIVFLCKKISCSLDDIIASEFTVYSSLGFRIPLWTSVQTGEMLAVEVGITPPMIDRVAMLVDLAEYRRHRINKKVHCAAEGPSSSTTMSNVLSLHLTAGAVAATTRLFHYTGPDIVPRLAQLTKTPKTYIRCIRDVVCDEIFSEIPQRTRSKRPLKRKC